MRSSRWVTWTPPITSCGRSNPQKSGITSKIAASRQKSDTVSLSTDERIAPPLWAPPASCGLFSGEPGGLFYMARIMQTVKKRELGSLLWGAYDTAWHKASLHIGACRIVAYSLLPRIEATGVATPHDGGTCSPSLALRWARRRRRRETSSAGSMSISSGALPDRKASGAGSSIPRARSWCAGGDAGTLQGASL